MSRIIRPPPARNRGSALGFGRFRSRSGPSRQGALPTRRGAQSTPSRPRRRLRGASMVAARRIGILTGGGDVPGLNSVIKSVVYRATELGYEVIGIRRGWEGLPHQRRGAAPDPEYVRVLDRNNTRPIDRTGGTMLHS